MPLTQGYLNHCLPIYLALEAGALDIRSLIQLEMQECLALRFPIPGYFFVVYAI